MGKKRTQRAIDHWLETAENSLLINELPFLKKIWEELSDYEGDYRGGAETYGYDSDQSIRSNMEYISDRWFCAFRVKWIIDGLENGKI